MLEDPFDDFFADMPALSAAPAQQREEPCQQKQNDLVGKEADTSSEAQRRGPKNLLDSLPDSFNEAQLEAVRLNIGKSKEGAKAQLRQWVCRKFITHSNQTGLYSKTEEYLTGKSKSK